MSVSDPTPKLLKDTLFVTLSSAVRWTAFQPTHSTPLPVSFLLLLFVINNLCLICHGRSDFMQEHSCSTLNYFHVVILLYIILFNVKEQLKMVVQNNCEVNREHACICSGILSTWLNQTEWSCNMYLRYKPCHQFSSWNLNILPIQEINTLPNTWNQFEPSLVAIANDFLWCTCW